MRELPIIFKDEMVRAIQRGEKTETRRVVKKGGSKYMAGDRLYVREAWAEYEDEIIYRADWVQSTGSRWYHRQAESSHGPDFCFTGRWKPSIFLPKKHSRTWLKIEEAHIEPLQDITEASAKAEGATPWVNGHGPLDRFDEPGLWHSADYRLGFEMLWQQINGKREGCAWAENPLVWAITFSLERS
jgi:hypothetical protein